MTRCTASRGPDVAHTGPIVALLSKQDAHHEKALAALRSSAGKGQSLCTTWEVVGEAYTVLRVRLGRQRSAEVALPVLRWARDSGVHMLPTAQDDHARAADLLQRYADHPLSYVDAIVLAIAERHRVGEVITVDARNFGPVRLAHRLAVTIV